MAAIIGLMASFVGVLSSSVSIQLYGGSGGSGYGGSGGQGGITTWTGTIQNNSALTIYVGGQGTNGSGGAFRYSGGGGGGSAVLVNGTLLAVAGGGGGGGSGTPTGVIGGTGGGSTGGTGGNADANGGFGGSQIGAGAGGTGARRNGISGSGNAGGAGVAATIAGSFPGGYGWGLGGTGRLDSGDGGSGGGGGGYFGGGSGGGNTQGAGGGGGSGYVNSSSFSGVDYSTGTTQNGGRSGNGEVVITVNGVATTYIFTGGTQAMEIGVTPVTPTIVTNGLLLRLDAGNASSYPGTGTVWTDLSGNSNNGTLTNGPTYSSNDGGSIVFDGVNDYVVIPRPVQDDFTLSCWFKTTQSLTTYTTGAFQWWQGAGLVDGEVSGLTTDFGLSLNAAKVSFGVGGSSDISIQSPLTYNNNVWHHAVATRIRSSGALVIYVDGASVVSGTGGTNSLTPPQLRIGSLQNNLNFFSGNISNVLVYNRALTAAEVLQNFNAIKSRYGL
jgi:hypothetical protein